MDELRISVEDGAIVEDQSWVYAWSDSSGAIFYIGATGLPIEARTWLHLNSEDPRIGRVLANFPEALVGRVDVRAWELPAGTNRQLIREALSADLLGGPDPSQPLDPISAAAASEILTTLRHTPD